VGGPQLSGFAATPVRVSVENGLPAEVRERIMNAVPNGGPRVIACMTTAARFVSEAVADAPGVRWAESAAYNLREALDSVVEGQDPAEGGLGAVLDEWARYVIARDSATDEPAAREALFALLAHASQKDAHTSLRGRQLLAYLRRQAGTAPLDGALDPIAEYRDVRGAVSDSLHGDCEPAVAAELLDRVQNWFIRMFTPPDAQATRIVELAGRPFDGHDQLAVLAALVTTAHQLRLFLSELTDPRWLDPLYDAGMLPMPVPEEPWPLFWLGDGLGRSSPEAVSDLLVRFVTDVDIDGPEGDAVVTESLRTASHLQEAGHKVVAAIVKRGQGQHPAMQLFGGHIAMQADPAAQVVVIAARSMIHPGPARRRQWGWFEILEPVVEGITATNARDRVRFLSGKLREAANETLARYTTDMTSLSAAVEREHDLAVVLGHHLVQAIARCRALGISTSAVSSWLGNMGSNFGQRVVCHLLAGADDLPIGDRVDHVARRIQTPRGSPTGDDRVLVDAVADDQSVLGVWRRALGTPSVPENMPVNRYDVPEDWRRAWTWSAVLPAEAMDDWCTQIDRVTTIVGPPSPELFDSRRAPVIGGIVPSPISIDDLAKLPIEDAVRSVAAWQPDAGEDHWEFGGAAQLAGALRVVVERRPRDWTVDPGMVLAGLREPLYIERYLEALAQKAVEIRDRAVGVLDSVAALPGSYFAPDPSSARTVTEVEPARDTLGSAVDRLIRELANADGDLEACLNWAWSVVEARIDDHPDDGELQNLLGDHDALHSAINRPWGVALEAALALARWEAVNARVLHPRLPTLLDRLLAVPGSPGMEFRAILASSRRLLEGVLPAWLDDHRDPLFRSEPLGPSTFDLTLRWAQPSAWLYRTFCDELYAAARRRAHGALPQLLLASLNDIDGYAVDELITGFGKDQDLVKEAVEEVPSLVQNLSKDAPQLVVALAFWEAVLDADRSIVPAQCLVTASRWAYVDGLADADWLRLTARTAALTGGAFEHPIAVADRCVRLPPDASVLTLLRQMLDVGERWEQSYVKDQAETLLRAAAKGTDYDAEFGALRMRLIELGRDTVLDVAYGGECDHP
jgi:hypothetical protein